MMSQADRPDVDEPETVDPGAADTGIWPAVLEPDVRSQADIQESHNEVAVEELAPVPNQNQNQASDVTAPAVSTVSDLGRRLFAAISHMNQMLDERLGALQTLFDREVRAEATRERIVDRLHGELQEYKQDLLLKVQRPIFIDLIQLHDDLGKMIDAQSPDEPEQGGAVRSKLASIQTAIEDILYRQGVEPFQNDGADFDPRRQRAVSTLPSEEPERNKTIAGRIRPGFQAGDKLIRPEIVSVFTLKM
jgi:molecular chaperone GrpE